MIKYVIPNTYSKILIFPSVEGYMIAIKKITIIFILLLTVNSTAARASNSFILKSEDNIRPPNGTFHPSEKIILYISLENLEKGDHNIIIDWIYPNGQIARKDYRDFKINTATGKYMVNFWIKFIENGPFTQMFQGKEYDDKIFGDWTVRMYLNQSPIATSNFVVSNHL